MTGKNPNPNPEPEDDSDKTLLFGVLTLILAIVAFTLLYINANLKKMADDKEGVPATRANTFL